MNGALHAAWEAVCIAIINTHKPHHQGATFVCPISALQSSIAWVLFVDNTDLLHMDLSCPTTVAAVHKDMLASIDNWGNLLIATGVAMDPEKCCFVLISFKYWDNGTSQCVHYSQQDDFQMSVPMPDCTSKTIKHLPVTSMQKSLGNLPACMDIAKYNCIMCKLGLRIGPI